MSRRSPLNERYQKDSKPKGASKKSAASAKPARKKGKTSSGASSSSSGRTKTRSAASARLFPDTEEYRQTRKKWWIVLGIATLVMTASLALTFESVFAAIDLDDGVLGVIRAALSWSALGLVGFSWWLDFTRLRPMMKAHKEGISFEEYQARRATEKQDSKRADNETTTNTDTADVERKTNTDRTDVESKTKTKSKTDETDERDETESEPTE